MIRTSSTPEYKASCFHQTMRELHFEETPQMPADLFSLACVEQFEMKPTTSYGYLFAQVFEPYVLTEIAELEGTAPELLEALEVGSTPELDTLRQRIAERQSLSPVEAVNTAAALISISRFALAELLLNAAEQARTDHRDKFEIAMLWFVIHNRHAEYDHMAADLLTMRRLIETGPLHRERKLDAASQAIVWHLKVKVLSATDFEWFLNLGRQIAETGLVDDGALSSWYRAVAMVPAAKGDKDTTREVMMAARKTADNAMKSRLNAYETHFLKTYHESSIKSTCMFPVITRLRLPKVKRWFVSIRLGP